MKEYCRHYTNKEPSNSGSIDQNTQATVHRFIPPTSGLKAQFYLRLGECLKYPAQGSLICE